MSEDGKSGAAFPGGSVQSSSKIYTLNLKKWISAFKESSHQIKVTILQNTLEYAKSPYIYWVQL